MTPERRPEHAAAAVRRALRGTGVDVLAIDARNTPPTVDALRYRLTPLLSDDGGRPLTVVLLDTCELLAESDARIREEIAPQLPADTLLIIAGQRPPWPAGGPTRVGPT